MRINQIKEMIQAAFVDEDQIGRFRKTLQTIARQNGRNPSKQEYTNTINFVREYVCLVPYFMEQSLANAGKAGLSKEMQRILSALEVYWFETNDLIPDHNGLLGILDDSYATLFLLQSMSEFVQQLHGKQLLELDLRNANQFMRNLIGEPTVSILEQKAGVTLANNLMQNILSRVGSTGIPFNFGGGNSYINQYEIDHAVNVKLGAMGIF